MQEYAEDGLRSSQKALRDLLDQIVEDESLSDKERKKKFKQVGIICLIKTFKFKINLLYWPNNLWADLHESVHEY